MKFIGCYQFSVFLLLFIAPLSAIPMERQPLLEESSIKDRGASEDRGSLDISGSDNERSSSDGKEGLVFSTPKEQPPGMEDPSFITSSKVDILTVSSPQQLDSRRLRSVFRYSESGMPLPFEEEHKLYREQKEKAYLKEQEAIKMAPNESSGFTEAVLEQKKKEINGLANVWREIGKNIDSLLHMISLLQRHEAKLELKTPEEIHFLRSKISTRRKVIHYLSQGADTIERVHQLSWGSYLADTKNSIDEGNDSSPWFQQEVYRNNVATLQSLAVMHIEDEAVASFFCKIADDQYRIMIELGDFIQSELITKKTGLIVDYCLKISELIKLFKEGENAAREANKKNKIEAAFWYQEAINYREASCKVMIKIVTELELMSHLKEDYYKKINILADSCEKVAQFKETDLTSSDSSEQMRVLLEKVRKDKDDLAAMEAELNRKKTPVGSDVLAGDEVLNAK